MKAIEILGILFCILLMLLVIFMAGAFAAWMLYHFGDPEELPYNDDEDDDDIQD